MQFIITAGPTSPKPTDFLSNKNLLIKSFTGCCPDVTIGICHLLLLKHDSHSLVFSGFQCQDCKTYNKAKNEEV